MPSKKTLLKISPFILITAVVPIVTLISCGSSNFDRKIESKLNPQISITEFQETEINLTIVQKVFDGIGKDNFNSFNYSWESSSNNDSTKTFLTIELKDGYLPDQVKPGEKIKSNEITIIISGISVKENPESIREVEINSSITISTVKKLFNGIDEINFSFLKTKIEKTPNGYRLIITTKSPWTFNGIQTIMKSEVFQLIATPIQSILTRAIVLKNLEKNGAWDILPNGDLTAKHLKGYTEIADDAFKDIQKIRPKHLYTVEIPNTITRIGKNAFAANITEFLSNDISLVTFEKNSTLEIIDDNAFYANFHLRSINFPSSLKMIGKTAFAMCTNLEPSFERGSQIEVISNKAFGSNLGITKLILPESLKVIGESAYQGSYNLMEIYIPLSVITIESKPFGSLIGIGPKVSIPKVFKNRSDHLGFDLEVWNNINWY